MKNKLKTYIQLRSFGDIKTFNEFLSRTPINEIHSFSELDTHFHVYLKVKNNKRRR
jgi:hypothetical protein